MKLYCIALPQSDEDNFLVEAHSEGDAVAVLASEIRLHGTPNRDRFAGGAMGHTIDHYRVLRVDDPIDLASWNQRTGAEITQHNVTSRFGSREINLLVRDGVIFLCDDCSGRDLPIYHAADPRMTLDGIRKIADQRSHRGLATEE